MSRIYAIVEGPTEQTFIANQLASHLGARGLDIRAVLPGRVHRRGGARAWESTRGDIVRALKESPGRYVTTMFDYYALPESWPGCLDSKGLPYQQKAAHVEAAVAEVLLVVQAVVLRDAVELALQVVERPERGFLAIGRRLA